MSFPGKIHLKFKQANSLHIVLHNNAASVYVKGNSNTHTWLNIVILFCNSTEKNQQIYYYIQVSFIKENLVYWKTIKKDVLKNFQSRYKTV